MFKFWSRLLPFVFLMAVLAVFFAPYLTGSQVPYAGDFTGSDLTELNLPFRALAAAQWRSGQLPVITDLLATGFPLLAEGQTGVLYPLNLLTFSVLPLPLALTFGLLLHFLIAAIFTYSFVRLLGVSRAGATLSALAFGVSGFFIFHLKHLNLINAAAWLPLTLYLVEKYRSGRIKAPTRVVSARTVRILLLLSLVLAVQFFAGHPQISFITVVTVFLYFIVRMAGLVGKRPLALVLETIAAWALVGLVTASLTAVQLLPSYEFFNASSRTKLTRYDPAVEFAWHPAQLLTALNPYTFGNPAAGSYQQDIRTFGIFWESSLYLGSLPLLLALLAFRRQWRQHLTLQAFLIVIACSLFIALGRYNPLFRLIWPVIPGLNLFRFPQRFLLPVILLLAAAAGIGFDWFINSARMFIARHPSLQRSPLLLRALPVILLLLTAIDLSYYNLAYIGALPTSYFSEPQSAQFIKQDAEPLRIFSFRWSESWRQAYGFSGGWNSNLELYLEHRELLPPNLNALWGIAAVDERGWLEGGQLAQALADFQLAAKQRFITAAGQPNTYTFDGQFQRLLGMQNVKYVLSFFPITGDGLTLKKEIKQPFLPPLLIYENAYVLPRAYAVFDVHAVADQTAALAAVLDSSFNPATTVVLERPPALSIGAETGSATVAVKRLKPSRNEFAVNFSKPGVLFFSVAFQPGWHVTVDGQPAERLRANSAFSAVFVGSGEHMVQWYFQPRSLTIGITVSLIASSIWIFVMLLLTLIGVRRRTNS